MTDEENLPRYTGAEFVEETKRPSLEARGHLSARLQWEITVKNASEGAGLGRGEVSGRLESIFYRDYDAILTISGRQYTVDFDDLDAQFGAQA